MPQPVSGSRMFLFGGLSTVIAETGLWVLYQSPPGGWTTYRLVLVAIVGILSFIAGILLEIIPHRKAVKRFVNNDPIRTFDSFNRDILTRDHSNEDFERLVTGAR